MTRARLWWARLAARSGWRCRVTLPGGGVEEVQLPGTSEDVSDDALTEWARVCWPGCEVTIIRATTIGD